MIQTKSNPQLTNHDAINELFSNFTWALGQAETNYEEEILNHWEGPLSNVYVSLVLFTVMRVSVNSRIL